jgi:hypothetical protein
MGYNPAPVSGAWIPVISLMRPIVRVLPVAGAEDPDDPDDPAVEADPLAVDADPAAVVVLDDVE